WTARRIASLLALSDDGAIGRVCTPGNGCSVKDLDGIGPIGNRTSKTLGPIEIGHIGRRGPISQQDEPLQIRITNSLLSACRKDDSVVLHSCGNSFCCWTLRWLFHCPSRFSTGRCLSNHVHPRP